MAIEFDIKHRQKRARLGVVHTDHGSFTTPTVTTNFTPALLRTGLTPDEVAELGVELLLVNTLHAELAGVDDVHRFLNWNGPVIADSGGYQMISLAQKLKIQNDGVEFEMDGKQIKMTPEKVLEIQRRIGIDMMMPLDFVVDVRRHNVWTFVSAVLKTEAWFKQAYKTGSENLYYIVQGGTSSLARSISLRFANKWFSRGVQLMALGGISLGESSNAIHQTVEYCCARLPEKAPRHLLGVGRPVDLVKGVMAGIDTFDCVAITREARHGRLWVDGGMVRLTQGGYVDDNRVIEDGCDCPTCMGGVTRASLRAGLKSKDARLKNKTQILLMKHNIRYVMRLVEQLREEIKNGDLERFYSEWVKRNVVD
ncbi:MAG: tRNA guanosine(34) transglycosylase Tgt [Patescibacteria group bacterium]